jgi:hypothetical protein
MTAAAAKPFGLTKTAPKPRRHRVLRGVRLDNQLDTSKNLDTDPKKPFRVRTFRNQMPNKPESNGLI